MTHPTPLQLRVRKRVNRALLQLAFLSAVIVAALTSAAFTTRPDGLALLTLALALVGAVTAHDLRRTLVDIGRHA